MVKVSKSYLIRQLYLLMFMFVLLLMLTSTLIFVETRVIAFNEKEYYLASMKLTNTIIGYEDGKKIELPRGTKLIHVGNFDEYAKVEYENSIYLVDYEYLKPLKKDVVLEEKMYVRTSVTVRKEDGLSLIKKGEEVEIISYKDLQDDGSVSMYKVSNDKTKGYVYAKYLTDDLEYANSTYTDGIYEIHNRRGDTLGGGAAYNLDFFPVDKPDIENNEMPEVVRSLYLNGAVIHRVDEYIDAFKDTSINAFVVDIKDDKMPAYKSEVMKNHSITNYNRAINTFDRYKTAIEKLNDAGFYTIGRITVFKDEYFIMDHPDHAIIDTRTNKPLVHNSSNWPTPYSREVWEFNVELAKEAVLEFGFNEIQFDYIRFPDRINRLERDGHIDLKNRYDEDKAEAVQNFLIYAKDELREVGAYISADVFGESSHAYVTAYGQYFPAISNVVDAISPMPYPDHFSMYEYGISKPVWTVPYEVLSTWGRFTNLRQKETPTPAKVRTWIQAYDAIRSPRVKYDNEMIEKQIKALFDNDLDGGFMTWNAASSLSRYISYKEAFEREY